jgi:membrane protein implicated in regulation of membrane protease activity
MLDTFLSWLDRLNLVAWWAIAGLILIGELVTGTTYLLWPAAAALLTGVVALEMFGVPWVGQLAIFAVLTLLLLFVGDRYVRPRLRAGADSGLNARGDRMVGQRVTVAADFQSGRGRLSFGDTEWAGEMVDASDPGEGEVLVVVEVRGVVLIVRRPEEASSPD